LINRFENEIEQSYIRASDITIETLELPRDHDMVILEEDTTRWSTFESVGPVGQIDLAHFDVFETADMHPIVSKGEPFCSDHTYGGLQ
jgi:hypothetical protein